MQHTKNILNSSTEKNWNIQFHFFSWSIPKRKVIFIMWILMLISLICNFESALILIVFFLLSKLYKRLNYTFYLKYKKFAFKKIRIENFLNVFNYEEFILFYIMKVIFWIHFLKKSHKGQHMRNKKYY